jgi:hypothetical protein
MVAMMLTYQPFLMRGLEDKEDAKKNAYGALALFIITFIVSVGYLITDAMVAPDERGIERRRRSGNQYQGIAQGTGPAVLEEYERNLSLPASVSEGIFT